MVVFYQKLQYKCSPVYQSPGGMSDVGIVAPNLENNMFFKAAHIKGNKNILADQLSWIKICPTEWTLIKDVVRQDFSNLEQTFDRSVCFSREQTDGNILHLDSRSQCIIPGCNDNIMGEYVCICFPHLCLIPRISKYMRQFCCQFILIAPQWPRRFWYKKYWNYICTNSSSFETSSLG